MSPYEPLDVRVSPNVGAVLSVRLSKEVAVALDEEARARGITMSDLIREAIEEHRRGTWTRNSGVLLTWQPDTTA